MLLPRIGISVSDIVVLGVDGRNVEHRVHVQLQLERLADSLRARFITSVLFLLNQVVGLAEFVHVLIDVLADPPAALCLAGSVILRLIVVGYDQDVALERDNHAFGRLFFFLEYFGGSWLIFLFFGLLRFVIDFINNNFAAKWKFKFILFLKSLLTLLENLEFKSFLPIHLEVCLLDIEVRLHRALVFVVSELLPSLAVKSVISVIRLVTDLREQSVRHFQVVLQLFIRVFGKIVDCHEVI